MEANGHTSSALGLVVDLVNALTAGERRGQPVAAPAGDELRAAVAGVLGDRPNRARDWARSSDEEHERLRALAGAWQRVVAAAGTGPSAVSPRVNELLQEAPVAPTLVDHDDEPWHLHAHDADAPPAAAIAATAALALATLVADGDLDRLGVCRASACDRTYLDTTRNVSRRYCSTACQARAKTAAYRARQA